MLPFWALVMVTGSYLLAIEAVAATGAPGYGSVLGVAYPWYSTRFIIQNVLCDILFRKPILTLYSFCLMVKQYELQIENIISHLINATTHLALLSGSKKSWWCWGGFFQVAPGSGQQHILLVSKSVRRAHRSLQMLLLVFEGKLEVLKTGHSENHSGAHKSQKHGSPTQCNPEQNQLQTKKSTSVCISYLKIPHM